MPALTKPHETYEKPGIVLAYALGARPVFKGALVGLSPAGEIAPLSPTEPMRFLGVSGESADPAAPGDGRVRKVAVVKIGSFVFAAHGFAPAPTDLGRLVYAASDWQVAVDPADVSAVGAHPAAVGTIVGIEPTGGDEPGVRVRIDLHTV